MLSNLATFKTFRFDTPKYRREYAEALYQLFIDACQAWVDAVLTSVDGSFPVWTGMAKASLVPVAEYLQVESEKPFSLDLDIDPHPDSWYQQQQGQDIEAGLQANRFKITRLGSSRSGLTGLNFYYDNFVPHYEINETNNIPFIPSSPWYSFEAGQAAFDAYIQENHERYVPVLNSYFSLGG